MDGFTVFDGVVALIIVLSAILAYSRGIVRETLAIAGWVIAAAAAFAFAPQVEPLVREIPYVDQIVGGSCELSIILAFAIVFAVTLILVSIFTPLFSAMIQRSALGPVDQGGGFLFGAARGILIVIVALIAYDRILPEGSKFAMIEESKSRAVMSSAQASLEAMIPEDAPDWIVSRYDQLTGNCAPAPSV